MIHISRSRVALLSVGATAVIGATVLVALPGQAAGADDCTASVLAHTVSGVTGNVASYLDAHPDVNAAFTNMKGQSRQQMRVSAEHYLAANPTVRSDLQSILAPLTDLAQRCGVSIPAGGILGG